MLQNDSLLVHYPEPLREAVLVKRYKRFLMDVDLLNGEQETIHCANSGSMKSCLPEGATVFSLNSHNPKRKLQHTLEIMGLSDGLACLNTNRANGVMEEYFSLSEGDLIERNQNGDVCEEYLSFIKGCKSVRREAVFQKGTRFDFLLSFEEEKKWVEIKSVSLREEEGVCFPDAVTTRGQKHLEHLIQAREKGDDAALFFVITRGQNFEGKELCQSFFPAGHIDPKYQLLLEDAVSFGVKVFVCAMNIQKEGLGVRTILAYHNR